MNNTQELSDFGYKELDLAGDLLKAYAKNGGSELTYFRKLVAVEFNPNSGNVFLTDDDFHVAMFNDEGKLEDFISCSNCGFEGFLSEPELTNYEAHGMCNICCEKEEN